MSLHLSSFSDPALCRGLLAELEHELDGPLRFMEVCGTHTVAIFRSGLRSLLPKGIAHLSGPGCPVCVTHDREVAAVNRLYQWAVGVGFLPATPIPQTTRRRAPLYAGWAGRRSQDEQRPATLE